MKQTRKQLKDCDAYIADKDGKRLYTFTDKEKKDIVDELAADIRRQTYGPTDRITSSKEFTTQDGKYYIDLEITFKGDFYCEQDWDTGCITEVIKIQFVEYEDWSCGIWEDEDGPGELDCEKVLDMIEEYFEYRDL